MLKRTSKSSSAPTVEVLRRLPGLPYGLTLRVIGIKLDPIQIANLSEYSSVPEVNLPTMDIFKAAKANKLLDLVVTDNGYVYATSNYELEAFESQVVAGIGSILTSAA